MFDPFHQALFNVGIWTIAAGGILAVVFITQYVVTRLILGQVCAFAALAIAIGGGTFVAMAYEDHTTSIIFGALTATMMILAILSIRVMIRDYHKHNG